MRNRSFLLLAALVLSGLTLSAHHSVAAVYDTEKLVTLVGVLTRVTIANPHLTFDLKQTSPDGTATTWMVEMAAPGVLGFLLRANRVLRDLSNPAKVGRYVGRSG